MNMKNKLKILVMLLGLFISSAICAQSISGALYLCVGQSDSFYASTWGMGFKWECSSNLSLSSTSVDPTTVTATGSGLGWVSYYNGSNALQAKQYVWVGVPSVYISGPSSVSVGSGNQYYAYSTDGNQGIKSYQWSVSPSYNTNLYDYGNWVSIYFYYENTFQVSVRASNSCGWGSYAFLYVSAGSKSASPAYPNPANDVLNVEVGSTVSTLERGANVNYDIRLYNGAGIMQRQTGQRGGGTVQIDVSNLPNGVYYLHINDGVSKKPETQQIIVKH
jgi:hypothetical protein